MTKKIFTPFILLAASIVYAQVGINTISPKATLDITGNPSVSTALDGVIAPRLTGDQLSAKTYTRAQDGAVVYVTEGVTTPTPAGQTVEVTGKGLFFFESSEDKWIRVKDTTSPDINLYEQDATLKGDRTVTQGGKTLKFSGTMRNAFSVEGTGVGQVKDNFRFSVDTKNGGVGIGTDNPLSLLSIKPGFEGGIKDGLSVGINNCGDNCGQATARNMTLYNAEPSNPIFAEIDFVASNISTNPAGASISGIDRDSNNNYAGLQFSTRNSTDFGPRMTLRSNGNVGIGVSNPFAKLTVDGAIVNANSHNAGSSRVIDFSKSNLAYTTLSAGAFILQNVKEGGSYVLAVEGGVSGLSSFSAVGYSVKLSSNVVSTTVGTETLYKFIVIGDSIYVSMETGFTGFGGEKTLDRVR